MKKVITNQTIQLLLAILILIGSFIINYFQGEFGFLIPFSVLIFFIILIFFVYYVISVPLINAMNANMGKLEHILTLEQIKERESSGKFIEIWIITSELEMAVNQGYFSGVLKNNLAKGIKYKFFISKNELSINRAKTILSAYRIQDDSIRFYIIDTTPSFVVKNTDYDLYFTDNPLEQEGYIGVTSKDNIRTYVSMPEELFLSLKSSLSELELAPFNREFLEAKQTISP